MTSIKDYGVQSDVAVGNGATITAITDGDEQEEVSIVGHLISSTIGSDFIVPRPWLEQRAEELGLTIIAPDTGEEELMIPPEASAKSAFTRTRDLLIEEFSAYHSDFSSEGKTMIDGRKTTFESKKVSNDEWHITAEAFFTADELNAVEEKDYDYGEHRQTTVMVCRYDPEQEGMRTPHINDDLGDSLREVTEKLAYGEDNPAKVEGSARLEGAKDFVDRMKESNIGRDIQKMLNRYVKHWTDSIKVRDGGAVYFVPAGYDDSVRALKTLIGEINEEHKHRGSECELLRVAVTDSEEEKRQIEAKARKHLENRIDAAMEAAFAALSEEDTLVEEIAEDFQDRVEALDADFADDYNVLLNAKLSAQDVVEERMDRLSGEHEEVVEQALEEMDDAAA